MYFTDSPKEQAYEKQMTRIPYSRPTPVPPTDTEQDFSSPSAQRKYREKSKLPCMKFPSPFHESLFKMEVAKLHVPSAPMLTALYLFTADHQLWKRAKQCMDGQNIHFAEIPLAGLSVPAYTLYKAAVTLCSEREELSFSELSDRKLIPHSLFNIISQAMSIRRYGASLLNTVTKDNEHRERSVTK
ncbi:MAG: hypothetical protein PHV32_10605 [Eubacteriales bacterium]|nr:hypothetical protein [Eubacteriales bacterium]